MIAVENKVFIYPTLNHPDFYVVIIDPADKLKPYGVYLSKKENNEVVALLKFQNKTTIVCQFPTVINPKERVIVHPIL